MKPLDRPALHAAAVALYEREYGAEHKERGSCLYWAHVAGRILRRAGERVLIQAGDMSWPILRPGEDDGVRPTHFSYEWSPHRPESQAAVMAGQLPEIHVWIALPDRQELVDFSVAYLPEQARKAGLEWRTPPPPPYLWCRYSRFGVSDVPAGVIYRAHIDAIRFVLHRIALQTA